MSKFKVGDRVVEIETGDKGTVVQPNAEEQAITTSHFEEDDQIIWIHWDDNNTRLWVTEDVIKKVKQKKFAIGAKVVDAEGDVGTVCAKPVNTPDNGQYPKDIFWAIWERGSAYPKWEFKAMVKRYVEPNLEPVSIDEAGWQTEPVRTNQETLPRVEFEIEFKNAFVPIKNCFRGAVVKWNGQLGHIVGFVHPVESDMHDTLYCNFYGNHSYVKCIELEMM